MQHQTLKGCSLLIVEDEPLLVMQVECEFANTGAELTITSVLHHATILVEHDGISAAILDHAIGENNCSSLYERLRERGIPFIIYSGYDVPDEVRKGGIPIPKPALPGVLVAAVEDLLRPRNQTWHLHGEGERTPAA